MSATLKFILKSKNNSVNPYWVTQGAKVTQGTMA